MIWIIGALVVVLFCLFMYALLYASSKADENEEETYSKYMKEKNSGVNEKHT